MLSPLKIGAPTFMLEKVPVAISPVKTLLTSPGSSKVNDNPSELTDFTLLNLSRPEPVWYLIIVSVFIPVNIFPGLCKIDEFIVPSTIPLGRGKLSKNESALNAYAPLPELDTDFISSIP